MTLAALDLFSGAAGGWSLGLERAGIETIAACEASAWRRDIYRCNFPGIPIYDDVRTLTAERLGRDLGRLPSLIVGSPPCQDASCANVRGQGLAGKRTGLWFEAIRIVSQARPRLCIFENVPGARTRGIDRLFDAMEAAGYACGSFVVGAWHAGAPHRRNRVWIVGVRADLVDAADADTFDLWFDEQRPAGRWPGPLPDRRHAVAAEHGSRPAADADGRRCPVERLEERAGQQGAQGPVAVRSGADGIEPRPHAGADADRQLHQVCSLHAANDPRPTVAGVDWLDSWADWQAGAAGYLRVADGILAGLAERTHAIDWRGKSGRYAARPVVDLAIEAYGDGVMPALTELFGRLAREIDAGLAA